MNIFLSFELCRCSHDIYLCRTFFSFLFFSFLSKIKKKKKKERMSDDTEIIVHWGADSRDSQPLIPISHDNEVVPGDFFSDSLLSSEYAPAYMPTPPVVTAPIELKQEGEELLLCTEQLFPPYVLEPPPPSSSVAPEGQRKGQRNKTKKREGVVEKMKVGQLAGRYVVFTRREFEQVCKRPFAVKSK
jgi:hypothetical protein